MPLDFTIEGGASVYILTPHSAEAKEWVADCIPEDALRYGHGVAIQWLYLDDIIEGIKAEGMSVV
jgi:hypothetical protein